MNATQEERARIKRRKDAGIMTMLATKGALRYIGALYQPEQDAGGFSDQTIIAARSALHHMERLSSLARDAREQARKEAQ